MESTFSSAREYIKNLSRNSVDYFRDSLAPLNHELFDALKQLDQKDYQETHHQLETLHFQNFDKCPDDTEYQCILQYQIAVVLVKRKEYEAAVASFAKLQSKMEDVLQGSNVARNKSTLTFVYYMCKCHIQQIVASLMMGSEIGEYLQGLCQGIPQLPLELRRTVLKEASLMILGVPSPSVEKFALQDDTLASNQIMGLRNLVAGELEESRKYFSKVLKTSKQEGDVKTMLLCYLYIIEIDDRLGKPTQKPKKIVQNLSKEQKITVSIGSQMFRVDSIGKVAKRLKELEISEVDPPLERIEAIKYYILSRTKRMITQLNDQINELLGQKDPSSTTSASSLELKKLHLVKIRNELNRPSSQQVLEMMLQSKFCTEAYRDFYRQMDKFCKLTQKLVTHEALFQPLERIAQYATSKV